MGLGRYKAPARRAVPRRALRRAAVGDGSQLGGGDGPGRRPAARRRRARGPDRPATADGAAAARAPPSAPAPGGAPARRPGAGGASGGAARAAPDRGTGSDRGLVAQERERVDVAAAVAGTARAQAQAPRRAQGAERRARGDPRSGAHREPAQTEVGGHERAAAHAHGQPAARERPGEGHAARAGSAHDGSRRRRHVDAAALSARERRLRRDVEGADHRPAQRPAPRGGRAGDAARHDQRQHDQGPEDQRGEDEG